MRYEKHLEILGLSCSLIEKNTKVFELVLFSTNSLEGTRQEQQDPGNLGRNLGHIQRHRKNGSILNPL